MKYEVNKDDAFKHLSGKYKKLKTAYEELKKAYTGSQQANKELKSAVSSSKKAMHFAVQKENFLRDRIITKYGRAAFAELMNHSDCPGGFNAEMFLKCTEKIEARK